jgi:hypothetical protein
VPTGTRGSFFVLFCFGDRVLLYSPGWPQTHEFLLQSSYLHLLGARIIGVHHHVWFSFFFFFLIKLSVLCSVCKSATAKQLERVQELREESLASHFVVQTKCSTDKNPSNLVLHWSGQFLVGLSGSL